MELAQKHKDQLKRIKKAVEKAAIYFKPNNLRFHEFQKFVFQTALSPEDEDTLKALGKPVIEFNITNAPISRLCGEFSKQEPSVYVSADDGAQVDPQVIEVVEGHTRHILFEAKKHNTQYNVYRDQLSGGFSDFKVWTEYAHEMSFDQVIRFGRTFEPTLTGFDPMAREVDKSDAEYCFEIFPMPKADFERDYPDVDINEMGFTRLENAFNWSYKMQGDDIVIIVDFYEKKKKRKKIVRLADNKVMTIEDYDKFIQSWMEQGFTEQPPAIVGEPRWTNIQSVCRYRIVETEVLEYKETAFKYLPLVFVDGDSVIIQNGESGSMQQFTKPYVYHAKGIQRLTNFSGQVIGNDFENMVMHKFKVAEESLPDQEEYLQSYKNVQVASVMVYKGYMRNAAGQPLPDQPLPPPQEIARVPLPQEVLATFNGSMQMLQNILGSYDAALGINDNQLSGVAIVEGATQSNAAAMPYIVNYMQALNQVAQIIVDLIPKYYVTPRTIPVVGRDGKASYVKINQPGGVQFNYDENVLQVKVEAGVNSSISKNQAIQQITALMNASPLFAEFINDEGLEELLDNIEFRGADVMKTKVAGWLQKRQQKMAQMAQQPNPQMIAAQAAAQQAQTQAQKVQVDAQGQQVDAQLKAQEILVDKMKADNDRLDIMVKAGESADKVQIAVSKAAAEEARATVDLHIKAMDQHHRHGKDTIELHHKLTKGDKDGNSESES